MMQILASYCPIDGCEQSWTAFVDKCIDNFTLHTRHFQGLKVVIQKAYAAYTELGSSGGELGTAQRQFYQRYKQMVLEICACI